MAKEEIFENIVKPQGNLTHIDSYLQPSDKTQQLVEDKWGDCLPSLAQTKKR